MTTVYPSGDNWKLDASCDYTLTQVYSQNTDPSGFQLILHLESHATGGIVVSITCFNLPTYDFPIDIIWMSPRSFLGASGVVFHFYFIFR